MIPNPFTGMIPCLGLGGIRAFPYSHIPASSLWMGFSRPYGARTAPFSGNLGMSLVRLLMWNFEERFWDFLLLLPFTFPIFQAFCSLWELRSWEPELKENPFFPKMPG